jgi:hypothetical protein
LIGNRLDKQPKSGFADEISRQILVEKDKRTSVTLVCRSALRGPRLPRLGLIDRSSLLRRSRPRCVGPEQVAHSTFVTSVDPTEARNAGQEKSGESISEFLARWYDEP